MGIGFDDAGGDVALDEFASFSQSREQPCRPGDRVLRRCRTAADPIMRPPEPLPTADTIVVESTYGDRCHPVEDIEAMLARLIAETFDKRGVLVVPAFAVGRAQHLLHVLARLRATNRLPECPNLSRQSDGDHATALFLRYTNESRTVRRGMCSDLADRDTLAYRRRLEGDRSRSRIEFLDDS